MINIIVLMFFPAVMAYAASADLLTMRISNRLTLALVLGFIVLAMIIAMPLPQFAIHLGIAFLVLIAAFTMFTFGWVGGGDAKLAAATALWLGSPVTLPYLIYAALCGGALTLIILILRRYPLPVPLIGVAWIQRLHNRVTGIPYGIALAAAGLLVYPQSVIFLHFAN